MLYRILRPQYLFFIGRIDSSVDENIATHSPEWALLGRGHVSKFEIFENAIALKLPGSIYSSASFGHRIITGLQPIFVNNKYFGIHSIHLQEIREFETRKIFLSSER